jgi:hypothetical protein
LEAAPSLDKMLGDNMRSPKNLSAGNQSPAKGPMGRAIAIFEKNGGILNTKRAVEMGVHPRDPMRCAMPGNGSGSSADSIGSPTRSRWAIAIL